MNARKQLAALVAEARRSKRKRPKIRGLNSASHGSVLEERFALIWKSITNAPGLSREFKFMQARRWRLDFAHPGSRTGIEIDGGTYSRRRSAHKGGAGGTRDRVKRNEARLLGWRVFELDCKMVTTEWAEKIAGFMLEQLEVDRLLDSMSLPVVARISRMKI